MGARRRSNRIIPARAGNTRLRPARARARPDHPRAGGEHLLSMWRGAGPTGSSPRGRGTPDLRAVQADGNRIIPARAGNTSSTRAMRCSTPDHPRAGGEHPFAGGRYVTKYGSSPRGRGTHQSISRYVRLSRIIPARAGNTPSAESPNRPKSDHPRAGGEHVRSLRLPGS